jgi:hypothetical protein
MQSFIVCRYNLNSHKRGKLHQAQRNHILLYIPTTHIEIIDQKLVLVWDDFEQVYALITSSY